MEKQIISKGINYINSVIIWQKVASLLGFIYILYLLILKWKNFLNKI